MQSLWGKSEVDQMSAQKFERVAGWKNAMGHMHVALEVAKYYLADTQYSPTANIENWVARHYARPFIVSYNNGD